jgi:hypothetical protein
MGPQAFADLAILDLVRFHQHLAKFCHGAYGGIR